MKRYIFIAFTLMFASGNSWATRQLSDILILDSLDFQLLELPLESHPEFQEITKRIFSKDTSICSAARRGYQAVWEIRENSLYIRSINITPCGESQYVDLQTLLNDDNQLIPATWFTGTASFRISAKNIEPNRYFGLFGYEAIVKYEAVVFEVDEGVVVSRNVQVVSEE